MQRDNIKPYDRLKKWWIFSRIESIFGLLGLFCFCMAIVCIPVSPRANPAAAQNLFNMVLLLPVFGYIFLGFIVSGLVFLGIAGHIFLHNSRNLTSSEGSEVSPEDRVQMAHEKKE